MFKMQFIENSELREWVKGNLRKAIFQKAHALAVQTGCEILVKLQDNNSEQTQGLYYTTDLLGKAFNIGGLHREPGDLSISGETGLPITPTVDQAVQSHDSGTSTERAPSTNDATAESESRTQETETQRTSESSEAAVPVGLSVAPSAASESHTENLDSSTLSVVSIKQEEEEEVLEVEKSISVKQEVMEQEEDGDTGSSLQPATDPMEDMQVDNTNMDSIQQDYQSSYPPMVPMSPKPYQCSMCHKAFRSIQVLQKHTQTFHMRPQNVMMGRKKSPYGGGGVRMKHSPNQPQVPFTTPEQQRYQCAVCNCSFRHPALLEDHMNRSHMMHPSSVPSNQQAGFPPTTGDPGGTLPLQQQQLTHSMPESGPDNDNLPTSDPSLPKITSVASLQHLVPSTSGVPTSVSASSRAPFTQGSPMAPMYRPAGSNNNSSSSSSAGSSSSSSRIQVLQPQVTLVRLPWDPNQLMSTPEEKPDEPPKKIIRKNQEVPRDPNQLLSAHLEALNEPPEKVVEKNPEVEAEVEAAVTELVSDHTPGKKGLQDPAKKGPSKGPSIVPVVEQMPVCLIRFGTWTPQVINPVTFQSNCIIFSFDAVLDHVARIRLEAKYITLCQYSLKKGMPTVFLNTTPKFAMMAREKLKMKKGTGPYFDPGSSAESERQVIVRPLNDPDHFHTAKILEAFDGMAQCTNRLKSALFEEIDKYEVNSLLVKSKPPEQLLGLPSISTNSVKKSKRPGYLQGLPSTSTDSSSAKSTDHLTRFKSGTIVTVNPKTLMITNVERTSIDASPSDN